MDCLQAREVISEAFDRGVADTPLAAEARRHCRTCAECRAFVEGLALLRKTPPAQAPPALVEAIVERGRKMAEAGLVRPIAAVPPVDEEAEPPASDAVPDDITEAPVFELQPVEPRPDVRDRWWWGTRIAASAAALVLAAFAVSLAMQGFSAMRPSNGASGEVAASRTSGAPMLGATPPAAAPEAAQKNGVSTDSAAATADTGGARYLDLGGVAYVWIGQRTPDRTSLEQDGSVTSSLDGSATPAVYDVWRSKTDADVVFIRTDPSAETYLAFRGVTRTLGGKPYALTTGSGISAFGVWPSLPSTLSTPTASDGSPTFVVAGKDDTGLAVYAPADAQVTDGFAVAPGTALTDPAGGNPNWTWWVRKK